MGGNASQGRIATYAYYTPDWYDIGEKRPFAVDSTVGINEYQFGRTTPDNKFVVASVLVGNDTGLLMTGGKLKKPTKKPTKKITPKKTPSKKNTSNNKKDDNFLKSVRKLFGMNTPTKKVNSKKTSNTVKPKTKVVKPKRKVLKPSKTTKKTSKPIKKRSVKRTTKK